MRPKKSGEISSFSHISINVTDLEKSIEFYLKTLSPLGFRLVDTEDGEYGRLTNCKNFVIILSPAGKKYLDFKYHRRAVGLAHFAISVPSNQCVDVGESKLPYIMFL
jgi:catechol 2,3-dioxygenase-like lactoylglutathione lyase family enzyme